MLFHFCVHVWSMLRSSLACLLVKFSEVSEVHWRSMKFNDVEWSSVWSPVLLSANAHFRSVWIGSAGIVCSTCLPSASHLLHHTQTYINPFLILAHFNVPILLHAAAKREATKRGFKYTTGRLLVIMRPGKEDVNWEQNYICVWRAATWIAQDLTVRSWCPAQKTLIRYLGKLS